MAYISSNANRWYCAREQSYGEIPAISAANRIPAVRMTAQHQQEKSSRRDKTGSRTWQGVPAGSRRHTSFDLTTYMRDWADPTKLPTQGPLFEAALGAQGALWNGGTTGPGSDTSTASSSTRRRARTGRCRGSASRSRTGPRPGS